MSFDTLLPYLVTGFMLFMFVSFSFVAWQKRQEDMERIRERLLDKGCREIVIHYDWFDFDKSNSTYNIECIHPKNGRIRTVCKIHATDGWDKDMYWKDPL